MDTPLGWRLIDWLAQQWPTAAAGKDGSGRSSAGPGEDAEDTPETQALQDLALIVDDQPEVREMTVDLFKLLGFDVLSAGDGAEALDLLKRNPRVSILFTDVMMPGMNGVLLANEAHKLDPALKVILVSGFLGSAREELSKAEVRFPLLEKPYRVSDLKKLLFD